MRNSRLLRRLPNPPRHFIHDHIIVRRIPAQQTSETDNRIVLLRLRQLPSRQWNLKRARHPDQIDIFFLSPGALQSVDRANQQSLSDERVEPGCDNRELPATSVQ